MAALPNEGEASEPPLDLEVEANASTRLTVDGAALAAASYPVTTDHEIGSNDFRISTMGPDGDTTYDAELSAVAYNSQDNEYFVVWDGTDNTGTLVAGEWEIYGAAH